MTIWRPTQAIRVKVLGLAWRGDQLLLAEVEDDEGRIKGVRALGGGIEFGETREEALRREFEEELGCAIRIVGPWHGVENLYMHEGAVGHEYIFMANVRLADEALYRQESMAFMENDTTPCRAGWFAPMALPNGVQLYPNGLLELIESGSVTSAG